MNPIEIPEKFPPVMPIMVPRKSLLMLLYNNKHQFAIFERFSHSSLGAVDKCVTLGVGEAT